MPLIHVCLCSDDTDLRPAAAAILSALAGAKQPERLVFHLITSPEYGPVFEELLRTHLEGARVEVHHSGQLQAHIQSFISFRESSKARKILASPFNFAPFYLHEFLQGSGSGGSAQRLIYLDTDTLVLGDLAEIFDMDLRGHSCAAVKYCLQTLDHYVNFEVLETLGYKDYDPKQCIANRGVLVIDVPRWQATNMTRKIEQWMVHYRNADNDLWIGGMSQPPWLLAMNGDYMELGEEWNCNSLGRDSMSMVESQTLRRSGFDHKALRTLGVSFGPYGQILPFVVTCSATGKLLHYNGAAKPWLADRLAPDARAPVCEVPRARAASGQEWKSARTVRIFCEKKEFVNCSELWSRYMSEEQACALKDFDREWAEDEARWSSRRHRDEASALAARVQQEKQQEAAKKEKAKKEKLHEEERRVRLKELKDKAKDRSNSTSETAGRDAE